MSRKNLKVHTDTFHLLDDAKPDGVRWDGFLNELLDAYESVPTVRLADDQFEALLAARSFTEDHEADELADPGGSGHFLDGADPALRAGYEQADEQMSDDDPSENEQIEQRIRDRLESDGQ